MKNVFITGLNSGFGLSLKKKFSDKKYSIFGISKNIKNNTNNVRKVDLLNKSLIKKQINYIFKKQNKFEYIILNAGILGNIETLVNLKESEIKKNLEIALYANKVIIDSVIKKKIKFKSIIAISSGASLKPKYGWFCYSLAKVSLRFLIEAYALEYKNLHFVNYNPGIMETNMQKKIRKLNVKKFPSTKVFIDKFKNNEVTNPDYAAELFYNSLKKLRKMDSGSYYDIRK